MTESDFGLLQRLLKVLTRIEDGLLVALLGVMIIMSAGQILLRNVFDSGFSNVEPFVRMLVLWVAMAGAIVASRQDKHINIDIASRFMPVALHHRVRSVIHFLSAVICLVIAVTSMQFVIAEYSAGSVVFAKIPAWMAQSIIPLGFGMIGLHYLVLSLLEIRRPRILPQ
jgi:TRAP-type C4-dicarboxylate transport system permease small subunit